MQKRDHRADLFTALQRLLPQHTLSRLLGKLANARTPSLKNVLIRQFVRHYQVDLSEADRDQPELYATFNDFFTRALQPGARPVDDDPCCITSPADGVVSQIGRVQQGRLVQAKNHTYSLQELLGGDQQQAQHFADGAFATIYLSPRDYHRVHMPLAGRLVATRYVPGKLFAVNAVTARGIPGLFARNERLVCTFTTDIGEMVLVLVGAMFVAGIETVWKAHYQPQIDHLETFTTHSQGIMTFAKGAEMGRFKFGSTVIMLLPPAVTWQASFKPGVSARMGEKLGDFQASQDKKKPGQGPGGEG